MENITSTAAVSAAPAPADSALRNHAAALAAACGNLLLAGLRGAWHAYTDPNTCSMYWVGTHPSVWATREK